MQQKPEVDHCDICESEKKKRVVVCGGKSVCKKCSALTSTKKARRRLFDAIKDVHSLQE